MVNQSKLFNDVSAAGRVLEITEPEDLRGRNDVHRLWKTTFETF